MIDMDTIVSLCKRRGFIFQSSEIYGGTGSCWDYGPLGVELKNNVKRVWWRDNVQNRPDMVGLDASILMHPNVWKASGHLDSPTHWSIAGNASGAFALISSTKSNGFTTVPRRREINLSFPAEKPANTAERNGPFALSAARAN